MTSSRPIVLSCKKKTNIGTWNVRTLYQTGKTAQLTKEMRRLNLTILGVCETRWTNYGKNTLSSGETIIYSGKVGDNVPHANGVAIVMNKQATSSLIEYEPVSDRIITARFDAKYRKLTIIQVYAPTNEAPIEEKDEFYNQLETSLVLHKPIKETSKS